MLFVPEPSPSLQVGLNKGEGGKGLRGPGAFRPQDEGRSADKGEEARGSLSPFFILTLCPIFGRPWEKFLDSEYVGHQPILS